MTAHSQNKNDQQPTASETFVDTLNSVFGEQTTNRATHAKVIAWSEKNKTIDLGVIDITQLVPDNDATNRALLFMPGLLPDGIESADPMIEFRNKTYSVSYERRHQQ